LIFYRRNYETDAKGNVMDVTLNIHFSRRSSMGISIDFISGGVFEVLPKVNAYIYGKDSLGEDIWYEKYQHESSQYYTFTSNSVFGVDVDGTEDSQVFLVPLTAEVLDHIKTTTLKAD
jgi:hypothetical protein